MFADAVEVSFLGAEDLPLVVEVVAIAPVVVADGPREAEREREGLGLPVRLEGLPLLALLA